MVGKREETGRSRAEASAGWSFARAGKVSFGGCSANRRNNSDLLSLAQRASLVRLWSEDNGRVSAGSIAHSANIALSSARCHVACLMRIGWPRIVLTKGFVRYGYRMIACMLNIRGWHVSHKRPSRALRANPCRATVERIWRRKGLKVPQRQPKKGRLWMNDWSCVRLRAEPPCPRCWTAATPKPFGYTNPCLTAIGGDRLPACGRPAGTGGFRCI